MNVEHEKFQGLKELSEITMGISRGRAELSSLEANKEEYLSKREQEALARVEQVLVDSEELIKKIGENHGELVGYRTQVTELHEWVRSLIQSVTDCVQVLNQATERLEKRVEIHNRRVETFNNEVRRERSLIEGTKEGLSIERNNLTVAERKVAEARKMVEKAMEALEINKK